MPGIEPGFAAGKASIVPTILASSSFAIHQDSAPCLVLRDQRLLPSSLANPQTVACGPEAPLKVSAHFLSYPGLGRFEAPVIEERRKGAETLLRFTVHIPALSNSPQLKEFFRVCTHTPPLHP